MWCEVLKRGLVSHLRGEKLVPIFCDAKFYKLLQLFLVGRVLKQPQRVWKAICGADIFHLQEPRLLALFRIIKDVKGMLMEWVSCEMTYHGKERQLPLVQDG